MNSRVVFGCLALVAAAACVHRMSLMKPDDAAFTRTAPDSFDVEMMTTKGPLTIRVRRDWSPNGADRFFALTRAGFFTDVAFHRTINKFVAQFGISGDTAISRAWRSHSIPDDAVKTSNVRGTLTYARGGPNSRSTQLYFNLVDNARLDTLNGFGFPPIGRIIEGLSVLDSLNWEYSGTRGGQTFPGPSQDSVGRLGNEYLRRAFPRIDYIKTARVTKSWP